MKINKCLKVGKKINCDKLIYGWVSYVKNCNKNFLEYGAILFMFAVKVHDLKSIDEIYKKCLKLFEDPEKNKGFLSIITESLPSLNAYYPEYIARYSTDTNFIIDSFDYKIEYISTLHLQPFSSNIEIIDLTPSISWTKYTYKLDKSDKSDKSRIIQILIMLLFYSSLPISFSIFHILNHLHIINEIYIDGLSKHYYKSYYFISRIFKPENINSEIHVPKRTITFMIPYIKFISYPQEYNWWRELVFIPQPSPFVKTITYDIYKTWNGEALINFKWNLYGKYYYFVIWIMFTALLGCFTAATTFSEDYISEDIRKRLFFVSAYLGIIHISFEYRQSFGYIGWHLDLWKFYNRNKLNLIILFIKIALKKLIFICLFRFDSIFMFYYSIYLLVTH